jgi:hypothetical protein
MADQTDIAAQPSLTGFILILQQLVLAVNALNMTASRLFPSASASLATTATAGTHGAPPAQIADYIVVKVGNTMLKVPGYLP